MGGVILSITGLGLPLLLELVVVLIITLVLLAEAELRSGMESDVLSKLLVFLSPVLLLAALQSANTGNPDVVTAAVAYAAFLLAWQAGRLSTAVFDTELGQGDGPDTD